MAIILSLRELEKFVTSEKKGRIVVAGGCFDILHIGHVRFLSKARGMGDYLIVLLESDKKVKKLKGRDRPFFIQKERAEMLSALRSVDLIVLLPTIEDDNDYLNLLKKIKPDIIAITASDPIIEKKKSQAKEIGAKLKVIPFTNTYSTSSLAKILKVE